MIISLEQNHYDAWNDFAYNYKWFWHTTMWLEYMQNSKFGVEFINRSFFIEKNGQITDIVPLIQEDDELYSPGFNDSKESLQEIKRIATENGIKHIQAACNIKKYLNIPSYTCTLDLDSINPTKGCKSAIKRAEKYLSYITDYDIQDFKADYFRIAGKQTRPDRTFELLGEWIKQGYGTLLTALCDGKIAGHTYILNYGEWAYYSMSCIDDYCRQYNVTHFLIWTAMGLLKQKGIKCLEMGEQPQNSLFNCPTDKEKNIAMFKRSFGGDIVVSSASEYFFNKEYFKQTMESRINSYIRSEYENNIIFPEA